MIRSWMYDGNENAEVGVWRNEVEQNKKSDGQLKLESSQRKYRKDSYSGTYGHVMRREEECVGRRVMALQADGDRRRGRPKWRWMDNITGDMRQHGLTMEDARDRARWKRLIRHVDPTYKRKKIKRKKKKKLSYGDAYLWHMYGLHTFWLP